MQDVDIERLAHVADRAAEAAGEVLMKHFGSATIEYKGVVDLVTNADREAERVIISHIKESFPDHAIVAEESGTAETGHAVRWYIDPIDGTTNYAHGLPIFAVSIGVAVDDEMSVGVVYNPAFNEKYAAVRGSGATLNGKRLDVSRTPELDRSLLATGFPYSVRETRLNNMDHFERFILQAQAVRRLGSAALDLAFVARGSFDGYWEVEVKPWDVAAGLLLVQEAGGRITNMRGEPFTMSAGNILASNDLIHDEMLAVIAKGETGLQG